jgi:hypothetical protein
MSEEKTELQNKGPSVDFSFQLNLAREKAEKKIFSYLSEISQRTHKKNKSIGAIIVLGVFGSSRDPLIKGMRKLTNDKLDTYINVNFPQFKDDVIEIFELGDDGAIAASFSTRNDVLATFTLSEETLVVRTWKDGKYTEQFNPGQKEEED